MWPTVYGEKQPGEKQPGESNLMGNDRASLRWARGLFFYGGGGSDGQGDCSSTEEGGPGRRTRSENNKIKMILGADPVVWPE